MAQEIERKFLIDPALLELPAEGETIRQGYIPTSTKTAVRVRIKGGQAFLTLKGENRGAVRSEFEYSIPLEDAMAMLDELCQPPMIDKVRYRIPHAGHLWEVDRFHGENEGLWVAEVELEAEYERVELPSWIRQEVTGDPRYYNANLIQHPYSQW